MSGAGHSATGLGDYSYGRIDRDAIGTLGMPSKPYLAVLALCLALVAFGGYCWGHLVLTGLGTTGIGSSSRREYHFGRLRLCTLP